MKKTIYQYLKFLETSDYNSLIKLFADDAVVHSPLYGDMNAAEFYEILFADTKQSKIELMNIFEDVENNSAAAYFKYNWTLANAVSAPFEVVDIFQFNERQEKIIILKIIYDTWQTRDKFDAL